MPTPPPAFVELHDGIGSRQTACCFRSNDSGAHSIQQACYNGSYSRKSQDLAEGHA
jgi:hypothetical protein